MSAPPLSDSIVATALDPAARRDLGGLQKDLAEAVARHLVAAGSLVDEDPQAALAHARYARRRASRIAIVREAAGIAAYHAGEWAEALAELRAARRMGGGPGHLAVMADLERAMGRPERAIEVARGPEARELGRDTQVELAIVVAGARRDLGELDAAVVGLQLPELDPIRRDPWSARLFYAYADNLLAAGRESDALQWFVHAVDADADGQTDADVRVAELTGEALPDEGIEFGLDDEQDDDTEAPDGTAADLDASGGAAESAQPVEGAAADDDAAGVVTGPVAGVEGEVAASDASASATESAQPVEGAAADDDAAGVVTGPVNGVDGAAAGSDASAAAAEPAQALDEAAGEHDAPVGVTGPADDLDGAAAAPETSVPATESAADAPNEAANDHDMVGDAAKPATTPDKASADHDVPGDPAESPALEEASSDHDARGGAAHGHHVSGDAAEHDARGDGTGSATARDDAAADHGDTAEPVDEATVDHGAPGRAEEFAGASAGTAAVHEVPGDSAESAAGDPSGADETQRPADSELGTGAADVQPTGRDEAPDETADGGDAQAGDAMNGSSAHVDGAPDVPEDLTALTGVESSVPDRTADR